MRYPLHRVYLRVSLMTFLLVGACILPSVVRPQARPTHFTEALRQLLSMPAPPPRTAGAADNLPPSPSPSPTKTVIGIDAAKGEK
jgi:hypothetical protein